MRGQFEPRHTAEGTEGLKAEKVLCLLSDSLPFHFFETRTCVVGLGKDNNINVVSFLFSTM